jgi:DNA end-binding protein Ku
MASSVWNGSLSISLLNVPVKLVPGTGDGEIELHQYRKADVSRIRFKRYAEADGADGAEVPWSELSKGYETGDGSVVLLGKEDFTAAYGEANKVGEIMMFTHIESVPRMASAKSYIIKPNIGGERTYSLLVAAMKSADKVAVLKYAMRERFNLAMIYVKDNYLVLEQLLWSDDVRTPDFAVPENTWSETEVKQAVALIDSMTDNFNFEAQHDDARAKLDAVVQSKIEGGHATAPTRSAVDKGTQQFADVMAGIQASLAAAKKVPAPRKSRVTRKESA